MTPLAEDFEPSADDVICGRGKKCYNHIGNDRFRQRVLTFLDEYSSAKSKLDKSTVLSKVVEEVRANSPHGGFIKQDEQGRWNEVGDFLAREKTSQAFRDALHQRYKSSNLSKKKRRQEEQAKANASYNKIVRSEYEMSSRLERLSNEVLGPQGAQGLDAYNRGNYEMLTRFHRQGDRPQRRYTDYRPAHGEAHFPDPLFGTSMNDSNSLLSEFGREKISPAGERRHRSYSISTGSVHETTVAPARPASAELKASFHRSLPEIDIRGKDIFDDSIHIHQSLPELARSKQTRLGHEDDQDKKIAAKDFDPIPLQQINISRKGGSVSLKTSPAVARPIKKLASFDDIQSSSSSGRSEYLPGGQRISKDFMETLDKMTYHSIADDNPFEPIPLTQQQEKELSKKTLSTRYAPMDESSERDEFAEG